MGFESAFTFKLENLTIQLLPLPYFLATKFDAFFDGGVKDLWASHDFEDIVYLFNHVSTITEQIESSENEVKTYLKECATKIIESNPYKEAIVANLYHEAQQERFDLILNRMKEICN